MSLSNATRVLSLSFVFLVLGPFFRAWSLQYAFAEISYILRSRKQKECGCLSRFRVRASISRLTTFSRWFPFGVNLRSIRFTERGSLVATAEAFLDRDPDFLADVDEVAVVWVAVVELIGATGRP